MTDYKHIDSTAYAADEPLDSFLLRRTHENVKAVREHRGRLGAWSPGTLNTSTSAVVKPQVSGYQQRSLIPFLWHLAPRVTEIKVAVRHRVTTSHASSGYEVQLSAFAVEISDFLSGVDLPAGQTSDLSGGASSSTTTTLTLDVSGLSDGWIVVCIGVLSGEAAAVEITNSAGAQGPAVYSGFDTMMHVCTSAANLGTTATVINHWGLLVKTTAGGKVSDSVELRQMLRYEYDNFSGLSTDLTYRLYVYPQFPRHRPFVNAGSSPNQSLYYVQLGVIDLESVTIYDSAVSHQGVRAALDASSPAAVSPLVARVREQHELFLENTRFHHLGPSQNPTESDFSTFRPVNVISGSRELSTSFQDICSCVVGRDDLLESGGTNRRRLVYTMRALVLMTYPTMGTGPPVPFDVTFNLRLTNADLSNASDQELFVSSMACIRCPNMRFNPGAQSMDTYGNNFADGYDSLAYLYGFGPQHNLSQFQRHTLRGVIPEADMGRRNVFDIEIQTKDSVSLITRRIATLQAKRSATTSTGAPVNAGQAPRAHILTWSVITTPNKEEVPASELGS